MNCGFCGKELPENLAPGRENNSCGHCRGGCRKLHCPYCGYANPVPGKLLRKVFERTEKKD